ncbi:MAG: hypothetical protein IJG23_00180 [Clostridia bacterium]|nr:hypothetical protein [Clostridia bacterium]
MPKVLIIVLLVVASLAIVALISYRTVRERIENSSQYARLKEGVAATEKVKMIAHRGLSAVAPENSLSAFRLAAAAGFCYIECDIHKTKDGHWVVMHDPTIDRMTNGEGAIADMTLEQIKQFHIIRGSGIEKYAEETVPTLKEYLQAVTEGGSYPVIEVKAKGTFDFEDMVALLREYHMTDKAIILDYDAEHLRTIRRLCPELKMQLLCHILKRSVIDTVEQIGNCGVDGMYNFQRNNALCAEVREKQIPLNMWTIDSEAALEKIIGLGASMATTNSLKPIHSQKETEVNPIG